MESLEDNISEINKTAIKTHNISRSLNDIVLEKLSRVTTSGRFIPEIDGLRFIAVVAVIVAHIGSSEGPVHPSASFIELIWLRVYHSGTVGVPLFFAISGFILAMPFAEMYLTEGRPIRLKRYYARRVLRIEPPYVINLTILLAIAFLIYGIDRYYRFPNYLASIFYMHSLIYNAWSDVNFVAWSLEVEAQFYILAPMLALVYRIRQKWYRRTFLFLAIIGLGILSQSMEDHSFRIRNLIIFHLHYFLVGLLLADLFVVEWRERPRKSWIWDLIATVAFASVFWLRVDGTLTFLIAPVIFVAYVGTFRGPRWSRLMSFRWITTIGGMCYTIYLYHFWILSPFQRMLHRFYPSQSAWPHLLLETLVCIPIIIAVSAVLFLLFEKPFMYPDWPSRLGGRMRSLVRRFTNRQSENRV